MVTPIPIVPVSACGPCEPVEIGQGCVPTLPAAAGAALHLEGPPAELERLMQALRRDLVARGVNNTEVVVRSLVLKPGEAELRLNAPACHGGDGLIDLAFQCLRRELPDTDVFVLPVMPKLVAPRA